jgi:Protein of unknown function (DUF3187)
MVPRADCQNARRQLSAGRSVPRRRRVRASSGPINWRTIAALAAALLVLDSRLRAQQFEFIGPAPTRNFQPIQLIFLNLPFESAATIGPGELAFLAQTVEISEIATTQGHIESTLKFESNRTNFGLRYSPFDSWEAGIDLPFISRYGGFLDPAIDWVESAFGLVNPERKMFPKDTFAGFSVVRGNTVLFDAGEENFQPGDLVFSVKRAFHLPAAWPQFALRGAIKAPTGDAGAVLGSGEPDFGAGLAADYSPWERLMFYLNFDVVYPVGPITPGDLTLNPFIDESFAIHLALAQHWSVMFHQATYTSPFHTGVRLLDGTAVELGFGMSFAYEPWFGAQVLGIENVSGVEQAADFSLMLSIVCRPWAQPTTLPPLGPAPPPPLPPLGEPLPHGTMPTSAASVAPTVATPTASP